MSQYNLRSHPPPDYAALHAGEDEEFHVSFEYPPGNIAHDQGASPPGVRNGQSSTPRTVNSNVDGNADEIAALNTAIVEAKADNAELEGRTATAKRPFTKLSGCPC